jgi:xylulokinase
MYLGIDIGTSGVKCVLIDDAQQQIDSASQSLTVSRPAAGHSEQNPDDWWQATLDALDALKASSPQALAAVRGIGLSGQMHGATLLDAADRPLRPAILWNDTRSALECDELERRCPTSREIAGNIAMPGFTAPKLLWVAKHEPDLFTRTRKVLLPKDYVRLLLSGDYATDLSDAAGTLWLDTGARRWSRELLEASGLDVSQMPQLFEGSEATGKLRAELCQRWGMRSAPVIAAGGGDNAATACGMGVITPGSAFLSLGTSGVLFASGARFAPNTAKAVHAFCHAIPDTWHQMGVMLSCADSLNWLARLTGQPVPALVEAASKLQPGRGRALFLPYLAGERTPHNDAAVRGLLHGLSHHDDAASLTLAVLEGVAYGLRDNLDALRDAGSQIDSCVAVGGGSQSRFWLRIIASCLDLPIDLPAGSDVGAAFGAARLGMLAATGEAPQAVCQPALIAERIEPVAEWRERYASGLVRYRAAYAAEKAVQGAPIA